MISIRSTSCCGLREVQGISNYNGKCRIGVTAMLRALMIPPGHVWSPREKLMRPAFPMVLFTQATANKDAAYRLCYGDQIHQAITRLKLGTVTVTEPVRNGNSGNTIRAYIWTPDWAAAEKFLIAENTKRLK